MIGVAIKAVFGRVSLLFALEVLTGVGLAWYWLGAYWALTTFVAATAISALLMIVLDRHVETFLFSLQGILLIWAGWLLLR